MDNKYRIRDTVIRSERETLRDGHRQQEGEGRERRDRERRQRG